MSSELRASLLPFDGGSHRRLSGREREREREREHMEDYGVRQGSWQGYPRIILPVFIAFTSVPLGDGEQQRCGARNQHLERSSL